MLDLFFLKDNNYGIFFFFHLQNISLLARMLAKIGVNLSSSIKYSPNYNLLWLKSLDRETKSMDGQESSFNSKIDNIWYQER